MLRSLDSAGDHWRRGHKAFANFRLIFAGLFALDDPTTIERLSLAESFLDKGLSPRDLLKEFGLDLEAYDLHKFNRGQPRVPAGNGKESGRWADGQGNGQLSAPDGTPIELTASANDPQGLKQAAAAGRAAGLETDEEWEAFHDAITGQGITDFRELVQEALDVKKKPKIK